MQTEGVGRAVRKARRQIGLRQAELAALADVGARFVSELENGKSTVELGRVIRVLQTLGLELDIVARDWRHIADAARD